MLYDDGASKYPQTVDDSEMHKDSAQIPTVREKSSEPGEKEQNL